MRTLAIGLDGCSWNVLDPLLETGELPNLARLREGGAFGVLESTVPPVSSPAWASFATGASPAAHGIYDFVMLREDGSITVAHQSDLRRATYYQQLGREGRRSVLINLPLDQNGCEGAVIVNSWLTVDRARQILPIGRRERYRSLLEAYRPFRAKRGDTDELCGIEQARFDLARELFLTESWDHFFVLFSSTDWLGHDGTGLFLRGDKDARAAFLRLYRQLDSHVGWLVEHAPDATAMVLSDHGQCEEIAVVRPNAVLHDLGLADLADPNPRAPSPFAVDRRKKARVTIGVPAALGRHRMNPFIRPAALLAKKTLRRGGIELTRARWMIDRGTSRAFLPTDGSFAVYTRNGGEDQLEGIREALLALRLEDGRPAIEDVWTPEELYGRATYGWTPTLLFLPAVGVRPSASIKDSVVAPPRAPGEGCHQRDGILMLAGPNVTSSELGRASICDLAPTLLWSMKAGVPADGDGRVLTEAFQQSFVGENPLRQVEPLSVDGEDSRREGEPAEVVRRLKALGYI
jgi:predicted AlkP superfamily phosphohydrolase/phosphomutase